MVETVRLEKDGKISRLILNRPTHYNAFNFDMIDGLACALVELAVDKSVRAIIITGEGKAFCAGGDLKWVSGFAGGPAAGFHRLAASYHLAVMEIRRMNKPVIAAINGIAAGGGFSLALACDFRVMEKSSTMLQAYTSNGLCIDGGGTFTLPRIVGLARALEIMAFDAPISSGQALSWGLVNKVVDDGKSLAEATAMARTLSDRSLISYGCVKQLLNDSFANNFESQIEQERMMLCACADGPDAKEGLKAFVEKRKPIYHSH
ncbi:MAG: enoyl-CoA hydratase-related protein [Dehalococcoidia bacterium]|jgi:2-(1,2-epoxy-1,2-dihydrophenyl)acetyl-CoA isomerase